MFIYILVYKNTKNRMDYTYGFNFLLVIRIAVTVYGVGAVFTVTGGFTVFFVPYHFVYNQCNDCYQDKSCYDSTCIHKLSPLCLYSAGSDRIIFFVRFGKHIDYEYCKYNSYNKSDRMDVSAES